MGLAPIIHIVQPGESLWTIAHAHGVTTDAILRFNDLPNPDHVLPGQRLVIPPAGGSDAAAVMALQGMGRREELLWPVKGGGIISSLFGPRQDRLHKGLDIAASRHVYPAAADGRHVCRLAKFAACSLSSTTATAADPLRTLRPSTKRSSRCGRPAIRT